jgi:hypothetical protein
MFYIQTTTDIYGPYFFDYALHRCRILRAAGIASKLVDHAGRGVQDAVTIKVPSGRMVVANIAKLRTVRGEIFADIEKEMNFGTYRLTDKLEDLVSC